ncbi:hypothetical protein BD413DRAFT_191267 [Trametes elegans]|nr:hypothetical protein BD413DRAFT_191267 [Trametes elegans]
MISNSSSIPLPVLCARYPLAYPHDLVHALPHATRSRIAMLCMHNLSTTPPSSHCIVHHRNTLILLPLEGRYFRLTYSFRRAQLREFHPCAVALTSNPIRPHPPPSTCPLTSPIPPGWHHQPCLEAPPCVCC